MPTKMRSKQGKTPEGEKGPNQRYGEKAGGADNTHPPIAVDVTNEEWNHYLDHGLLGAPDKTFKPASSRKATPVRAPTVTNKLKSIKPGLPKPPLGKPGGPHDPEPQAGPVPPPKLPGAFKPRFGRSIKTGLKTYGSQVR